MFHFLGQSCGKNHYYLFCRVDRGVAAAVLSSITATLLSAVRVVRKSVWLPPPLKKENYCYYDYQYSNNPYYVVNNLVLLILFTQLVTSKKFTMFSLTFTIIITIVSYCFITLTNQKVGAEPIAATRRLTSWITTGRSCLSRDEIWTACLGHASKIIH